MGNLKLRNRLDPTSDFGTPPHLEIPITTTLSAAPGTFSLFLVRYAAPSSSPIAVYLCPRCSIVGKSIIWIPKGIQAWLKLSSPHRKNSQKPGGDLINHFQDSFGGVIARRHSDVPHLTRSRSQDDLHLLPGGYVVEPFDRTRGEPVGRAHTYTLDNLVSTTFPCLHLLI